MIDPTNVADSPRSHRETEPLVDLVSLLARKVVGQSAATRAIIPYVYMYQSGLAPEGRPAVLADYMLGEDDGLKLALEFQAKTPTTRVVLMTGGGLTEDELNLCGEKGIPILFKPFLASEVIKLIKTSAGRQMAAGATSGSVVETRKSIDTV